MYGKASADEAVLSSASLYYQSALVALPPIGRIKLVVKRVWIDTVHHLKAGWQFIYTPVKEVLRNLQNKIEHSLMNLINRFKSFIKKK